MFHDATTGRSWLLSNRTDWRPGRPWRTHHRAGVRPDARRLVGDRDRHRHRRRDDRGTALYQRTAGTTWSPPRRTEWFHQATVARSRELFGPVRDGSGHAVGHLGAPARPGTGRRRGTAARGDPAGGSSHLTGGRSAHGPVRAGGRPPSSGSPGPRRLAAHRRGVPHDEVAVLTCRPTRARRAETDISPERRSVHSGARCAAAANDGHPHARPGTCVSTVAVARRDVRREPGGPAGGHQRATSRRR